MQKSTVLIWLCRTFYLLFVIFIFRNLAQAAPASAGASATISLEDCTADFADMNSMQKLPNQVQLVESDLPLSEAENVEGLFGNYLFRYYTILLLNHFYHPSLSILYNTFFH